MAVPCFFSFAVLCLFILWKLCLYKLRFERTSRCKGNYWQSKDMTNNVLLPSKVESDVVSSIGAERLQRSIVKAERRID